MYGIDLGISYRWVIKKCMQTQEGLHWLNVPAVEWLYEEQSIVFQELGSLCSEVKPESSWVTMSSRVSVQTDCLDKGAII